MIISSVQFSFAEDRILNRQVLDSKSNKVIFININRKNLQNLLDIDAIKDKLETTGYVAHMNIRGDKGTNDRRSYASMGSGSRVNVTKDEDEIIFSSLTSEQKKQFKVDTGVEPKEINYYNINRSINENESNNEYGSTLGVLGQTLSDNGLKTAVLGNSDIVETVNGVDTVVKNRNLCLTAMDNYGRIDQGNVDDINIDDNTMPFGISTDYKKLTTQTKEFYNSSDVLFVDLGDTYRLDIYKNSLNEETYEKMKDKINSKINKYLKEVFGMVSEGDTVYIVSGYPSTIDYKNRRRLSPVIKFKGEEKGLLTSNTTRREGIIANIDLGTDILNEFGLKSDLMIGKKLNYIAKDNNIDYAIKENKKQVALSLSRAAVINTFVIVVSASWIVAAIALGCRSRFSEEAKAKVFKVLKELIKFGMIMPFAFMVAGLLNQTSQMGVTVGIFAVAVILYGIGRIFIKDDFKNMGTFALATITLVIIDTFCNSVIMRNDIMSYDAIVGARYYGIGNEYEGVVIGSAIFAISMLLNLKIIKKWMITPIFLAILFCSAYPSMGANVGGAISGSIAFFLFVMLVYNVKIDFKKICLLGFSAVAVVAIFAFLDIKLGLGSHLGEFVHRIFLNGPHEVIMTFARKIQMNLKIAQTSVWVNILIAGIVLFAISMIRPTGMFLVFKQKNPEIFSGFIATTVGCFVTLLVNDSGIVAAATASIYIFIPIIIFAINKMIFDNQKS
jgi:hypothetical protein